LFHIQRKAVIDHAIEEMHNFMDADKILVIVGRHKGAIINHIGDGSHFNDEGLKVGYLFQEEQKGLAHAIYQAKGWVEEDFIVHVGDSFVYPKEQLKKAVTLHEENKPFATIIAMEEEDPTRYGILKVNENNEIIDAVEKPGLEEAKPFEKNGKYLAITAIYIFNKEIFNYIEKTPKGVKDEYQITDSIKLALKDGKKMKVFTIKGKYMDIGNWESAEEAHEFLRKV
jgi:bifunctional UDP-N-acetylglucosamine pyrophosphorylase/glucosamine-1-phosphate N-acetyltransferase